MICGFRRNAVATLRRIRSTKTKNQLFIGEKKNSCALGKNREQVEMPKKNLLRGDKTRNV